MGFQNNCISYKSNNNANSDFNCSIKLNNISSTNKVIRALQKACGNGIISNILRCNTKRCKFQLDFHACNKAVISVTKIMYDGVTPPGTMCLNWPLPNFIHLITCCSCSF